MLKAVEGIVISETTFGENSKIINILTKDGIIGLMAKGAKNLKSSLRIGTMKFAYSKFQVYYHEDKLSTVKEVDIINEFKNIKSSIELISYMAYLCDLAQQVMKQNNNSLIYFNLIATLIKINDNFNPIIMTNIYELKMLDYLGVGIVFDSCAKCGSKKEIITIDPDDGGYICKNCFTNQIMYDLKTLKMLRMYYLVDINTISDLKISNSIVSNINYFINTYYDRYTGLYLKTKQFLNTIKK